MNFQNNLHLKSARNKNDRQGNDGFSIHHIKVTYLHKVEAVCHEHVY
jgi:hypothetical protein